MENLKAAQVSEVIFVRGWQIATLNVEYCWSTFIPDSHCINDDWIWTGTDLHVELSKY
jgi:hypothetical protein